KGSGAGGDVSDSNAVIQVDSDSNASNFWFNVKSVAAGSTNATIGFAIAGVIKGGLVYNTTNNYVALTNDASASAPTDFVLKGSKVGIGTASPAQMLDISGSAPSFQMSDTTASAKSLRVVTDANVANFYEAAGSAGD